MSTSDLSKYAPLGDALSFHDDPPDDSAPMARRDICGAEELENLLKGSSHRRTLSHFIMSKLRPHPTLHLLLDTQNLSAHILKTLRDNLIISGAKCLDLSTQSQPWQHTLWATYPVSTAGNAALQIDRQRVHAGLRSLYPILKSYRHQVACLSLNHGLSPEVATLRRLWRHLLAQDRQPQIYASPSLLTHLSPLPMTPGASNEARNHRGSTITTPQDSLAHKARPAQPTSPSLDATSKIPNALAWHPLPLSLLETIVRGDYAPTLSRQIMPSGAIVYHPPGTPVDQHISLRLNPHHWADQDDYASSQPYAPKPGDMAEITYHCHAQDHIYLLMYGKEGLRSLGEPKPNRQPEHPTQGRILFGFSGSNPPEFPMLLVTRTSLADVDACLEAVNRLIGGANESAPEGFLEPFAQECGQNWAFWDLKGGIKHEATQP